MDRLAWVCVGSALGGAARYWVSLWALRLCGPAFPYGTLVVNVVGSFCVGLLMQLALETSLFSPGVQIFLATGVLGGFTTYSTFNYETLSLASDGDWQLAGINLAATVAGCMGAGMLGLVTGRVLAEALVRG